VASGVLKTKVGYAGGTKPQVPTYRNIGDYVEAIQIEYDPRQISYSQLLKMFFEFHDPTTKHQKRQYISAIFYHDDEQKTLAEEAVASQRKTLRSPVLTEILSGNAFFDAEDYHQKYLLRSQPVLFRSLGLDGDALKSSTVAAKVNGYCGGYGQLEQFRADSAVAQLKDEQKKMVSIIIDKGGVMANCGV